MLVTAACAAAPASAQYLLVTDTDDDKVMLFDAFDGSVIDADFLLMDDLVEAWSGSQFDSARTPHNAVQVGNEIWVSDNGEDSIFRVNAAGNVVGRIGGRTSDFMGTGGLNDIRGFDVAGNTVYVTNDGSSNGAPGDDTMVTIDATTGAITGSFPLRGEAEDVLVVGDELYVTNPDGNNIIGDNSDETVDVYDLSGNYLRTIVDGDAINVDVRDPKQITRSSAGILVASQSFPAGIFEYDLDGNVLDSYLSGIGVLGSLGNILGVHELGNGDLLFTVNNLGVYSFNRTTGVVTQQLGGVDPLFIEPTSIPAPGVLAMVGLAGFGVTRRRR